VVGHPTFRVSCLARVTPSGWEGFLPPGRRRERARPVRPGLPRGQSDDRVPPAGLESDTEAIRHSIHVDEIAP
jgi:hypothetical protein